MIELNVKIGAAYQRAGPARRTRRGTSAARSRLRRARRDAAPTIPFTRYYIACLYALRGDARPRARVARTRRRQPSPR